MLKATFRENHILFHTAHQDYTDRLPAQTKVFAIEPPFLEMTSGDQISLKYLPHLVSHLINTGYDLRNKIILAELGSIIRGLGSSGWHTLEEKETYELH